MTGRGGKLAARFVLFDLDGTLVDSAPDIAVAIDAMLERLGCPPAGFAQVRNWVGDGAARLPRAAVERLHLPDEAAINSRSVRRSRRSTAGSV